MSDNEDLPPDFFDELDNKDFMSYLASDDEKEEDSNELLKEIQHLQKDIEERKKKLYKEDEILKSKSRSKSPRSLNSRNDRSRDRYRRRSRERNPRYSNRNIRRRTRSRSRSRGNRRRSRTRPRSKVKQVGESISFLEELAETFAQQGKPCPEIEELKNKVYASKFPAKSVMKDAFYKEPPQIPLQPQMPIGPPQMYNNFIGPNPFAQNSIPCQPQPFPLYGPPMGMDICPPQSFPQPQPRGILDENVYKNPTVSQTDEVIQKAAKEKVITRCTDAVKHLRIYQSMPYSTRFLHTPTILNINNDNISCRNKNNISFKLTKNAKTPENIKMLSETLKNIVTVLGYDCNRLLRTKTTSIIRTGAALNTNDALPDDLTCDVQTQTEDIFCEKCVKNSLKEYQSVGCETRVTTKTIASQTITEDVETLAEMTPAQLRAINDFGKIMRNGINPKNYREACDLRDSLYSIYEASTGGRFNLSFYDDQRMDVPNPPSINIPDIMDVTYMRRTDSAMTNLTSKQIVEMEQERQNRNMRGNVLNNRSPMDNMDPRFQYNRNHNNFNNNSYNNNDMTPNNNFNMSPNDQFEMNSDRQNSNRNNSHHSENNSQSYPRNRYQQWNW